jgi:hypothetical protein
MKPTLNTYDIGATLARYYYGFEGTSENKFQNNSSKINSIN